MVNLVIATGQLGGTMTTTAFDRVGGFDVLAKAVGRFIARLSEAPALASFAGAAMREDTRWRLQLLLTDLLGGPMAYDGPDPAELRHQLKIDAHGYDAGVTLLTACFVDVGAPREAVDELRSTLGAFGRRIGLAATVGATDPRPRLIARAKALVEERHLEAWNLFVLDPHYAVIHQSSEAVRATQAVDADLRRAFGLGANDIPGNSFLRFHPAPTQLQGMLTDRTRLPRETTWCFGRNTWKASLIAVEGDDGALLGYAVAWHDESEASRVAEVFRRLRAEAEELPVPLMYPSDPTCEIWHGNAACEVALERLTPYLPRPVNPLEGVPASLFFPDAAERRSLFRDPEQLPHKRQVRFGPETVSILVSPVRDQEQRFLGPQITWEIVYFTRADEVPAQPPVAAVAAPFDPGAEALAQLLELSPSVSSNGLHAPEPGTKVPSQPTDESHEGQIVSLEPTAESLEGQVVSLEPTAESHEGQVFPPRGDLGPRPDAQPSAIEQLRGNARVLEQAGRGLQQLASLIDSVALLTAQGLDDTAAASAGDKADAQSVTREVEAAQEALGLARQSGNAARPEIDQALQWLERLARQTNLLAVQSAADVLREDAAAAGDALREAVDGLTESLASRVDQVTSLAQSTANTLHAAGIRASRVRALRTVLADDSADSGSPASGNG